MKQAHKIIRNHENSRVGSKVLRGGMIFFVKCILIQAQNSHRQLAGHEEREADKMGEYKFINEELKIGAAS